MEPPGGVFGVVGSEDVLRGMGGGGPPEPVRRCVGIGGGPAEPVEEALDDVRRCVGIGGGPPLPVRRCVGIGGGALLGDLVGGGAGAASLAIRAAIAEALPEDLGVFAAAFSFLAASSLAFAFAIISATPIFVRLARRCCRCVRLRLAVALPGCVRLRETSGRAPRSSGHALAGARRRRSEVRGAPLECTPLFMVRGVDGAAWQDFLAAPGTR
jgi:hypothetical protein